VRLNWYHDEDDDTILEFGQELQARLHGARLPRPPVQGNLRHARRHPAEPDLFTVEAAALAAARRMHADAVRRARSGACSAN
jgi:hypothetical protein